MLWKPTIFVKIALFICFSNVPVFECRLSLMSIVRARDNAS
jgi:hypothetical protein